MDIVITQFSFLILVVLLVSFIARLLKQPLIIGYIIAGIIAGPGFLNIIYETTLINTFSEFGISFLLFLVGLNLSPRVIKEYGKISLVTGLGQIIFTSIFGYIICIKLGFSAIVSLYIAVALTFSSTIIIMKLLSDKDDIEKLYGKISIGFLLVQDLVAILVLMGISSLEQRILWQILFTFSRGVILVLILILFTRYILNRITNFLTSSQEFLFLFVIVWGLGLSFLFKYIGFSMEIGSLTAGILLSTTSYNYAIVSKLKVLRDFFIIFFFVFLGSQLTFQEILKFLPQSIVLSFFILIGNPLIVMVLMGTFRYTKRTGFLAGLTVAQISEFSLILIAMGVKIGHIPPDILSLVTFVGVITIGASTYLILYADRIYPLLSKYLNIFERKTLIEREVLTKRFGCFLIGYNRTGFDILKSLQRLYSDVLVIDFNPEVIRILKHRKINCVYGDAEDVELLELLKINRAYMVVSTAPDLSTNLLLLKFIREKNKKPVIILTARQISDALILYENGADYVILPHFLGGLYTAQLIEKFKTHRENYVDESDRQIQELMERIVEGQEHPPVEKEIK
ncbi:MAG: cation:proton antiporter [Candidatus Omnitrophica bacterium]|nr:cation:proton antiporter [Candidatus Omnitrophota bacterium]